ncbi:hypothetical protein BDZ94DRAFT_349338 [Collybia nuda]|uniref:Zn(2)-C6 fungal-type domain-containing protein n=1 Tax=Collybia nuda TaxID=64659 RepID=A0A9P5YB83_9AGAR|nr:hypothetical protein BDZ94DRAFT_349338 [Collybia nuda]
MTCAECKRRKIKCDRSQPCAPCTRRGEQSRCQWHIVEPIEKYVTRAEYDELKARFDELAAQVQRLLPASGVPPYYQMGMGSGLPGANPEAVSTYATASPLLYQPMMAPQTYPHHLDASTQGPQRFIKPEETQALGRHHQGAVGTTASPAAPMHASPTLSRPRPKSPTSTVAKHSPLSLASITSPYHPDTQSKNCHAQTLMLGERLRPGPRALEDPAVPSSEMAPLLRTRRRSQGRRRRYTSIAAGRLLYSHPRSRCPLHLDDSSILLIARQYQHGMTTGNY